MSSISHHPFHQHQNPIHQHQHHISPKTNSLQKSSQQWKEELRRDCLKRAKVARMEFFMRRRRGSGAAAPFHDYDGSISTRKFQNSSREAIDVYNEVEWDEKHDVWMENSLHSVAKTLVEHELHKSVTELNHCHLQTKTQNKSDELKIDEHSDEKMTWGEEVINEESKMMQPECEELLRRDTGADLEECKMSHHDYVELLNDVTEELPKEDEMFEEEMWDMERLEAMKRKHYDNIDEYKDYW